ncbi:YktB family protein [Paenibacillus sp. GCM10027628]|uniref:YktB family protein n=1 Tax=Paenibacillus sp. GCM10027628 TaxID=3273413 RepID=UPI0036358D50
MTFNGFTSHDFDTFAIEGLDGRMEAIRERIQPKFKTLGDSLCADLTLLSGTEMFLHIAKHARRTVNPPVDTWMAICPNKRGYKQVPHFQVGLFDDRVFLWLALIYELPNKSLIATRYMKEIDRLRKELPSDFVISFDHMKKDTASVSELDRAGWQTALTRFRDVKKAELLIGRNLASTDPMLTKGAEFEQLVKQTFETLLPLYQMAVGVQ